MNEHDAPGDAAGLIDAVEKMLADACPPPQAAPAPPAAGAIPDWMIASVQAQLPVVLAALLADAIAKGFADGFIAAIRKARDEAANSGETSPE